MRKTLLVIVVLFVAAQAYAGTVTLSVTDEGDGWAAIRYSATDANVSAFGLKVTADSGAIIADIADYNVGECTATVQGYGIFPGTIVIDESNGVVTSDGTPIAPNTAPGAADTGLNTNTLILEMGALYVEGNEPDLSGTLIKVQVDGDCNVCVEGEPVRGNVVLTDATEATLSPAVACGSITTECYTGPDYAEWVAVGKPDSWCWDRQCHGDADNATEPYGRGTVWVGMNDVAVVVAGLRKAYTDPITNPWISADFDHATEPYGRGTVRVGMNDVSVLLVYLRKGTVPTDCNTGSPVSP